MRETVISWTAPNIITIALMMIISGAAIGFLSRAFMQHKMRKGEE